MNKYLLLLFFTFWGLAGRQSAHAQIATTDFVIQVAVSGTNQFTIPTFPVAYNYDVDYNNDGTWDAFGAYRQHTITYGAAGSYIIRIRGAAGGGAAGFPRIYFNGGGERLKITKVLQWGNIAWTSFAASFSGCSNLDVTATDVPNLSGVTSMTSCFNGCSALVGTAAFSTWNTSTITDMSGMFSGAGVFNKDLSSWNVSAVQNFQSMFQGAIAYTNDGVSLSSWNPVAATNLASMFRSSRYNMPLAGNWCGTTLQGVTSMAAMFQSDTAFSQDISCWM